jgi:ATP-dependent Lon protease
MSEETSTTLDTTQFEPMSIIQEDTLPLLPLKNVVLLPKSIIPVIVGRESSIRAVEHALRHDKIIFATAQKSPDTEVPALNDIFSYGTRAKILQAMRMPNNAIKILIEGICRAKIIKTVDDAHCTHVIFEDIKTTGTRRTKDFEAVWRHVTHLYHAYAQFNEKAPQELTVAIRTVNDIDYAIDTIAVQLNLSFENRQKMLEQDNLKKRLFDVANLLQKEIDILETERRIQQQVQTQVERNQREYYLNEQIKAIHKELGRDDHLTEINELRAQVQQAHMPKEALEKCERELKKLEQMQPYSAEAVVSRNYLDWMISLPWSQISRDRLSLSQAEKLLNKSHAGLKKPKDRILEFVAAQKFSRSLTKATIICFVGPPGVGKTSLAKSIAESIGREFVRISLGGVRDESEIRGHRRTYIGALPGKIIQAMKKAHTINPVMLLDEIDKLSHDAMGDPSSALLEVLDPEQNHTFTDHYLDVEYDLSKVMFITTANYYENIPYPLLDRMEIINLAGYTEDEKCTIARDFLVPKKCTEYGVSSEQFTLPTKLINVLIEGYTKEAGVRQLERVIAKLIRKTIQVLLKKKESSVTITEELITQWLGHKKFKPASLEQNAGAVGLSMGLAWTECGGDVLEIETTTMPGKGNLTLTGQLGDVMQESAQAAMSYIKTRAKEFGLKKTTFTSNDIHIHLPEGATPKDGPSAGITMACSLISSLTNTPLEPHFAMTGEITLRGRVLGVGGLKEKILAAKRYGMKTVLVPRDNYDDIQDELKGVDHGMELIFVTHMDEVVAHAFSKNNFKKSKIDDTVKSS